jgi:OOP family OmpA-OmpF porin
MGSRWLLGVIIIAIISFLLALFGPLAAKKRSAIMGDSVQAALDAKGLGDVKVDMRGNVAFLEGASSEEMAEQATKIAENARCENCQVPKHKWHVVRNDMEILKPVEQIPTASPYTLSAIKTEGGEINIEGFVRNEEERRRITVEAESLFPNLRRNINLTVAKGYPNDNWGDVNSKYLNELAILDYGTLSAIDTQVTLTGGTSDATIRDRVVGLAADQSLGFAESASISVPEVAPAVIEQPKAVNVCQAMLDDIKGNNKVSFDVDSEVIRPASFGLLENIASAAQECPGSKFRIEGHTDSVGVDAYNQDLSQRRANTVLAFLADRGVPASSMSAVGFGESRPAASNDTEEGRSANRRIEFIVTQAN